MKLRNEITGIVDSSHPGCNQKKECYTDCGYCGADQILPLFLAWLKQHTSQVQVDSFKEEMNASN